MRLTLMSDYAMRLLLYLANHPGRLCTVGEVARAHDISHAHLTKVAQLLTRRGWVQSVRGKAGGLQLARMPHDIVLGQVLRATEPDFALVECMGDNNRCGLYGSCGLNRVLQQATSAFLQPLDRTTLADITPPAAVTPLR